MLHNQAHSLIATAAPGAGRRSGRGGDAELNAVPGLSSKDFPSGSNLFCLDNRLHNFSQRLRHRASPTGAGPNWSAGSANVCCCCCCGCTGAGPNCSGGRANVSALSPNAHLPPPQHVSLPTK
ncbi:hypothetical protein niasHT_012570 [Heterodera trifolii]|uniref:Uncharacterized protein n=1 Tax=Heterodera trifolii TaxID=157864 RepID=A0ABD2L1J7_9BILA